VILDELSCVPTGKLGAELLVDVIGLADQRTSVTVTTKSERPTRLLHGRGVRGYAPAE
jgi:hypothetical protein